MPYPLTGAQLTCNGVTILDVYGNAIRVSATKETFRPPLWGVATRTANGITYGKNLLGIAQSPDAAPPATASGPVTGQIWPRGM